MNDIRDLSKVDIFKGMQEEALRGLLKWMEERDYSADEPIFHQGDQGDSLYIILSGMVDILLEQKDNDPIVVATLKSGDFLGEMSLFDLSPRSASCVPRESTRLLLLDGDAFHAFTKESPLLACDVMDRMRHVTLERLNRTGGLLSQMVALGEEAQTRVIRDDFTGFYNRHFYDESMANLSYQALKHGNDFCLVMVDLDHFGKVNQQKGPKYADKMLLKACELFKDSFDEKDQLIRYGGDEFLFLLPDSNALRGYRKCLKFMGTLHKYKTQFDNQPPCEFPELSVSMGVASWSSAYRLNRDLFEMADEALYDAKEQGRCRAILWDEKNPVKNAPKSISQRNIIMDNIIDSLDWGHSFLLMGHKNPDEDCLSCMISMALIVRNLSKEATVILPEELPEKFKYMEQICQYNSIRIHRSGLDFQHFVDTICIVDTPKPGMEEDFGGKDALLYGGNHLILEVDHHLKADSRYFGHRDFSLVDEASSACQLVGLLAFKLEKKKDLLKKYHVQEVFSRNFVLSLLTGIIGDTKMGKFLKSKKEKRYYNMFSKRFNDMLHHKTRKDSKNFASMDQLFLELQSLNKLEQKCHDEIKDHGLSVDARIKGVVVPQKVMTHIDSQYDRETMVSVARYLVDQLAEKSGTLGFIAYPDNSVSPPLYQFRVRRNHDYQALDLRTILNHLSIENGGGHPGAIGFRLPQNEVANFEEFSRKVQEQIISLLK